MNTTLQKIEIPQYKAIGGVVQDMELSYQLFGKDLHSAPIVLVNHALKGN